MLDVFRSQTKSLFIYLILGVIILAFILTFNTSGPLNPGGGADVGELVTVAGTEIGTREFSLAMGFSAPAPSPTATGFDKIQAQRLYERSRMPYSGVASDLFGLTPFDGDVPPVKSEKVMTELIESILVAEAGKKLGLGVTDVELTTRVMRLERIFGTSFKDDQGSFDPRKYDIFVRYTLGCSKATFESFLRREILRDKVAHLVTAGVQATAKDAEAVLAADEARPKITFIAVDADVAKSAVKVSADEATQWAKGHAEDIKSAYEAATARFNQPEKWRVRGLLIDATWPEAAGQQDPKDDAAQKKDIDAIKADFDKVVAGDVEVHGPKGADGAEGSTKKLNDVAEADRPNWLVNHFSEVAQEKSRHTMTKDFGGQFAAAMSADELANAPFDAAIAKAVQSGSVGRLLGPFKTDEGYWLVMVAAKEAAKSTDLAAATGELATELLIQERAGKEIDKVADGLFALAQKTPKKDLAEVAKAWNKATTGSDSGPLAALPAGPIGKSQQAAMTGGIEAALGLPPKADDPDSVAGLGKVTGLGSAIWALTKAKPLASKVFKSADGNRRFVVQLAGAKPAKELSEDDKKAKAKSKKDMQTALTNMTRLAAWRSYVKKLIADAEGAGQIDRSSAWSEMVDAARKRYADSVKRAPRRPALGAGSPLQVNVGGKSAPIKLNIGGQQDGDAKAADKPADPSPAPEGAKPAAAADKPATK